MLKRFRNQIRNSSVAMSLGGVAKLRRRHLNGILNSGAVAVISPTDIAGLAFWLKADSLVLTNADPVTTWADSSGNARDAAQATVANKPLYITNVVGGKPVVRFDGINDHLITPSIAAMAATTVFLVVKNANATSSYAFIMGADNNAIISEFVAGKWEYYITPRTQIGNTSTTAFQIIKTNVGSSSLGTWFVGSASAAGNPIAADIAEIIVYNSVLSAGNESSVTAYLQNKYGAI